METSNTEKRDTTSPNSESGKEVAKKNSFATFQKSKLSPAYWREKVFRPEYGTKDNRTEVSQFYARIQHAGRREAVALNTNDREAAARSAAKFYQRVKSAGWTVALAEFAPDKAMAQGVPTVGAVIEAVSQSPDIGANTLRGYVVCFRKLAAEAYGVRATKARFDYRSGGLTAWRKRVDSIRLDRLTPARMQNVLNRRIMAAKGNPLAERKARITAASVLRQAKALFAAERKLPFENLPNPFKGVAVEVGTPPRYVSTVKAADLARAAKAELGTPKVYANPPQDEAEELHREQIAFRNGEAYKAFLLALGAGLRANEIDNLQWQHVDGEANTVRVMATETFDTKTESSEREVFVDAGLIAELERFRTNATGAYVLESERQPKPGAAIASYRAEVTFDALKKWLRAHGITAHKPIHTLRKEFGSLVCESADIFTASRQLGHASIALTATYYTENRRRVAPQIGAMLNPQKLNKKGKAKQ
jgi:integrase